MNLLKDILYKSGAHQIMGSTEIAISNIAFDSRALKENGLFIAIKGEAFDGHNFIEKAILNGATAIVCQEIPSSLQPNTTYVEVKDTREALAHIATNFYDHPSQEIDLVGVTGTNGKTTSCTLLHQLFSHLNFKAGLISTVECKIGEQVIESTHTTPDPITLNKLLRSMIDQGCSHCFMEVSSHAVVQHRITGLEFTGGVFTNITHDHLDYHKTFEAYLKAKKTFFDQLNDQAFALYNNDDANGKKMCADSPSQTLSFGLSNPSDYRAKILESSLDGLHLSINNHEVWIPLHGRFNAYNALGAFAVARELGIEAQDVLVGLSKLEGARGRFQLIRNKQGKTAIIDYAHTPDALQNVLETIHDIKADSQKIICLVGCGGNRDKEKRPKMARIASDYAHRVILTSDNPRDEVPSQIIDDMMQGVSKKAALNTLAIENRKEAIKTAISIASEKDIILIAGKGHETYQEIKGIKHPFSDLKIVEEFFNA